MEISEKTEDGVRLLSITGRLDSNTSRELEQQLLQMVGESGQKVLVDLEKLHYISSAGLRVFLLAAKKAKKAQTQIVLSGMDENVQEVFDISGFSSLFTITGTAREGLTSLQRA